MAEVDSISVGNDGSTLGPGHSEQLAALTLAVHKLIRKVDENHKQQQEKINSLRSYCSTQFAIIHRNMERYYFAPARQAGTPMTPLGQQLARAAAGPAATQQSDPPTEQQQQKGKKRKKTKNQQQAQQPAPPVQTQLQPIQPRPAIGAPPQLQPQIQPFQPRPPFPGPLPLYPQLPPEAGTVDPDAVLGKPKTLLELWHEFLHGLDGHKPAKDFTPSERGKVKVTYSRRMDFWRVMMRLIRAGYNEYTAIQLIEASYGKGLPVSSFLQALQKAKSDGYHPNIASVIGER